MNPQRAGERGRREESGRRGESKVEGQGNVEGFVMKNDHSEEPVQTLPHFLTSIQLIKDISVSECVSRLTKRP